MISFLDVTVCLNYQEYYFKEKQENNNQSKEIDDILSETLNDIKYSERVNLDNAVKKISRIMTDYGFEEIKTKSELADTCKNIVNKNDTQEDISSILEKIKNALNQAILSEALNILTSNLELRPISAKLMNVVETFLFSDLEDASDDLKKILGGKIVKLDKREEWVKDGQDKWILKTIVKEDSIKGLIKNSNDVDNVLESLKSLKETKIRVCKACDFLMSCSYEGKILGDQENTKNAIKEIAKTGGNATNNETQNKQLLLDHIKCIIETVQKYKLDIEDENPLKNVIRMFLDKKNNIQRDVIRNKINEMLKEQIYTEMLKKKIWPAFVR